MFIDASGVSCGGGVRKVKLNALPMKMVNAK